MLRQSFAYDLKLLSAYLFLAGASVLAEGLAISTLMLYTNSLSTDSGITGPGTLTPDLIISFPGLILAFMVLLIVGSLLRLLSRTSLTKLASALEERITMDVLTRPDKLNPGAIPLTSLSTNSYVALKSIALKRARLCGRSVGILMQGITDAARAIVFLALCLYLATEITVVLCAVTTVFLFLQLRFGRTIYANQLEREKASPEVSKEMNEILISAFDTLKTRDELDRDLSLRYQASKLKKLRARYRRHINSASYSELIGNLNLAVGMALGTYLIADSLHRGAMDVGEVVAFVVAARFLLTSVKSLFGKLASFSKLYNHTNIVFNTLYSGYSIPAEAVENEDVEPLASKVIISNISLNRISAAYFFRRLPSFEDVDGRFVILPARIPREVPSFEELTGYSSLTDFKRASETRPLFNLVWDFWRECCKENSIDPLLPDSWQWALRKPQLVYAFSAIGFRKRGISALMIAYELVSEDEALLDIIQSLNPAIAIYLFLSEAHLPSELDGTTSAFLLAENGHLLSSNLAWANNNLHSVRAFFQENSIDRTDRNLESNTYDTDDEDA